MFAVSSKAFALRSQDAFCYYCPPCIARWERRFTIGALVCYLGLAALSLQLVFNYPGYPGSWFSLNVALWILFWLLLSIPHELGHVLAARLLGLRIYEITFGSGPTIFSRHLWGMKIEVKPFPVGGVPR